MELYFNSKTQHTTVKHSQQLYEHNVHICLSLSPTLDWLPNSIEVQRQQKPITMEVNYSLIYCRVTLETKAVYYCCVIKDCIDM
jgi:hypothetical protein